MIFSNMRQPKATGLYTPVQDGIERSVRAVRYSELPPPESLAKLVHCFWELRTHSPLTEDFLYHALPDACVNLLLNQVHTAVAGVTALYTRATVLNLGQSFHYVGVQFYPGVWQGNRAELADSYVGTAYQGGLPLVAASERMRGLPFVDQAAVLTDLVTWCVTQGVVAPNAITARILAQLDRVGSVADMAALVGLSARQLQRVLRQSTGFSPHDLLKVLRVQQSFRRHYLELYADQSHYIHAFRQATGYTPTRYRSRFSEPDDV